ncbi:hypothetical protein BLNAU_15663 [Blattamonas nauphoetae]|uniref:Transposase n=1 Tax=Blattamonas nauphoetae TaxID=2049346 RepID=A0ABQ9XDJ6_9EUKA|nr:hypothetical protein BLNAU_15663 [Blattamonas nauphoetae]
MQPSFTRDSTKAFFAVSGIYPVNMDAVCENWSEGSDPTSTSRCFDKARKRIGCKEVQTMTRADMAKKTRMSPDNEHNSAEILGGGKEQIISTYHALCNALSAIGSKQIREGTDLDQRRQPSGVEFSIKKSGVKDIRVEIDEAYFIPWKNHRVKDKTGFWRVGDWVQGVPGYYFVLMVAYRDHDTLDDVIKGRVAKGSVMTSDQWKSFESLKEVYPLDEFQDGSMKLHANCFGKEK